MFTSTVAAGEWVALWSPGGVEPEPRLRVLLPGDGTSTRARAATAAFVPSVQQAARPGRTTGSNPARRPAGTRPGNGGAGSGRPGRTTTGRRAAATRMIALPGDPSPTSVALAAFLGHPGGASSDTDRATGRRLGLTSGVTEVGLALIDLGCWRARIADLPPGPDLVTALSQRPDALAPAPRTDPDQALRTAVTARTADVGDRVVTGWANAVLESITARGRVLSWLQAEQYTDLALLSKNYPGLAEMLPTEIAFALRTSESAAGNAISTARTFSSRLPGTLAALHGGLIDADHAIAVARATGTTTAEVAGQVENDLLPEVTQPGSSTTAEQLRRKAARRVIIRDPDGAADRHATAAKDKHITRWVEDDGIAGLKVIAPAQQIAAIWEASTAMADAAKTPGDTRTLGARRVDALTDICSRILAGTIGLIPTDKPTTAPTTTKVGEPVSGATPGDTTTTPSDPGSDATPGDGTRPDTDTTARPAPIWPIPLGARHGRKPHIQVVIPYTVLLGADDPCELLGHGTITADQARLIAADGLLQRLLTDPATGTVLDYGRTRYEPPNTLKQFIIARDGTCRTPGCNQPADRCEMDHVTPYRPGQPTGGSTDHTTLDAKCKHHHRAKDGGGFTNTRDPDGTSHWTTPLGRHYTRPPHTVCEPVNLEAVGRDQPDPGAAEHCAAEPDWDDRYPPAQPPATGSPPDTTEDHTSNDDDPPPF